MANAEIPKLCFVCAAWAFVFAHFVFIGMLIDEIALKFNHKNGIPIASVAKSGRKKSGKKSAARFITESANVKIQYILHDILL